MTTAVSTLRANLQGSPGRLLVITILQLGILLVSTFVTVTKRACDLEDSGQDQRLDCASCGDLELSWEQLALLIIGLIVIMIGMYACIRRDTLACQIYGMVMIVFAFFVGFVSVSSFLEVPVLHRATNRVPDQDSECAAIGRDMQHQLVLQGVLYLLTALLDSAGAIYAIRSKQLFDYTEIVDRHERNRRLIDENL